MKMTILERDDNITHVVLSGRLDATAEQEIAAQFVEATSARDQPAIIDLSEIDFLASRGIGLLVANSKRLKKKGHRLVLLNPQELVEQVIRTSKIDAITPIVRNVDEAVQMLGGASSSPLAPDVPHEPTAGDAASPQTEPTADAEVPGATKVKVPIRNELSELDGLNASLAQFLAAHDVPKRAAYAMNLAIDELVVNVMRYAYVDDEVHIIDVEFEIDGAQVILRIEDDGRPFDPRTGPSLDLHAEERESGGLGLLLVLDMVDVLTYEREGERNHVEVRIHLIKEDPSDDPANGEQSNVASAD